MATTTQIAETFACTADAFETKYGSPPIGGAWVVFDAEGNSLTGHVVPVDNHRQALAYAGARLTAEAVEP